MAVKIADNKEHSNLTIENMGVKATIYKLSIDGQISYIGCTQRPLEKRAKEHISQLQNQTHKNLKLSKRYAYSSVGEIEVEAVLQLPSDNKFLMYFCEGLVNSYYGSMLVNDVVIAEGKGRIKLPRLDGGLAKKLLEVIADWYNVSLNL